MRSIQRNDILDHRIHKGRRIGMVRHRNIKFYGQGTFSPIDRDSGNIPSHQYLGEISILPDSSVHQPRKWRFCRLDKFRLQEDV